MSRKVRRHHSRAPLFAVSAAALILYGLWSVAGRPHRFRSTSPFSADTTRLDVSALPARTVFAYSVIPGGVWSAEELAHKLARDPVAAAHYAAFESSAAHFYRLTSSRSAYVSYRVGDKVYWTRKPVALGYGEMILTDGKNDARARCGNRISETPQAPVGPDPDLDIIESPSPGSGLLVPARMIPDLFSFHFGFVPSAVTTSIGNPAASSGSGIGTGSAGAVGTGGINSGGGAGELPTAYPVIDGVAIVPLGPGLQPPGSAPIFQLDSVPGIQWTAAIPFPYWGAMLPVIPIMTGDVTSPTLPLPAHSDSAVASGLPVTTTAGHPSSGAGLTFGIKKPDPDLPPGPGTSVDGPSQLPNQQLLDPPGSEFLPRDEFFPHDVFLPHDELSSHDKLSSQDDFSSPNSVPEPSTGLLLLSGAFAFLVARQIGPTLGRTLERLSIRSASKRGRL